MKKLVLSLAFIAPVFAFTGCGGHEGGQAVDTSDKTAVEEYLAQEAKDQAAMDASLSEK